MKIDLFLWKSNERHASALPWPGDGHHRRKCLQIGRFAVEFSFSRIELDCPLEGMAARSSGPLIRSSIRDIVRPAPGWPDGEASCKWAGWTRLANAFERAVDSILEKLILPQPGQFEGIFAR